jgi:hypothetical protein
MRHILFLFIVFFALNTHAQFSRKTDPLTGSYSAIYDGVKMTLVIEHKTGTSYTGIFNDSYQSCPIVLELAGNSFSGVLTEPSTGVGIDFNGEIQGDHLLFSLIVDALGEEGTFEIAFSRDGSGTTVKSTNDQNPSKADFPSGASHPKELAGTWTRQELYQSGSSDSYMGAGFSQSMTFLPDGGLAEGGSSAYMSGSNYSGQSSGQGGDRIPGVTWYTIGNQLYMQGIENGQLQNIHLGKYYIENNHMLITGTNGEKILLTRSN